MEVIEETNIQNSNNLNTSEQNSEIIPKLNLENEPTFQMITKELEKKEDQSFNTSEKSENNLQKSKNEKSTEENSVSFLSNKNSKGINTIENNERKNIINLNIDIIKEEKYNDKKDKKRKKMKLNNISPEVYMGENIVRTDYNINPMEVKLKRLEKEIKSQYNYDYNKAMKEIKDKLENIKKREEQIKHMQEEDKKMKEKLKNMEEYRENKMKELIKRVEKKQKINRNKNKRNKNYINEYSNKSSLSNDNYIPSSINEENENGRKKLPPIISSYDKYKRIIKKKESNEQDFILNTEEDIKNLELDHQENYNYINNLINQKLQEKKKIYDERNDLYSKYRLQKEIEKQERFLEKDIKHRYNVQLTIIKSSEEKNGKLQDKIKKNLENFNEKKLILKEKEKKKVKEYLKRINKYKVGNINNSDAENKRKNFLDLQKENIIKTNKDLEQKYSDILDKQEYLLSVAYDIEQKDINNKKHLIKNSRKLEDKNEKIYKDFNQFLGKIEKSNINNKNDSVKLKMYNKKVKEELEEKNRKEEEELKRLGL